MHSGLNQFEICHMSRRRTVVVDVYSSALLHAAWLPVVSFDNSDLSRAL